ncbi:MAG: hypothetical protein QXD81_02125 [Candidatus Bathyarchaeia archaeon]
MMGAGAKYSAKDLVDFPKEVQGDDTLEKLYQYLRVQAVVSEGRLRDFQLFIDRRVKPTLGLTQPKQADHVYIHFSTPTQCLDAAALLYAAAALLAMRDSGRLLDGDLNAAIEGGLPFLASVAKTQAALMRERLTGRVGR